MNYCRDCHDPDPLECERKAMSVDLREFLECGCLCHDETFELTNEDNFHLGEYLDCDVLNIQKPLQMDEDL